MDDMLTTTLEGWHDYYLITGGAAAALTGLQFVVQTLIASGGARMAVGDDAEAGIATFGSPTVVHFSLALLLSCLLCVPWPSEGWLRASLLALGVGALLYWAVVVRRARRQRGYVPVAEDWVWHIVLPGLAYGTVVSAAVWLRASTVGPLFALGAATVVLLCVGIHNAWDTVLYLSLGGLQRSIDASARQDAGQHRPRAAGVRKKGKGRR